MRLTGIWHTSRGISDKALNADQGSEWESVITAASLWKSKKLTLASSVLAALYPVKLRRKIFHWQGG